MKFTIYGERCSGTNFLELAIINNFDLELTWEYNWKHFFGDFNFDQVNTDDVIFLAIVRNPIEWICSFYNNPHHVPEELKTSIDDFITKPFYSLNEENEIIDNMLIAPDTYYKNIFHLREVKLNFLINVMPKKVKNYCLINYEDLRDNYEKTLLMIQRKFKLQRNYLRFKRIVNHQKTNNVFVQKNYINDIKIETLYKITRNINIDLEKNIGY